MAGCILDLYRSAVDVGIEWAPAFHDIAKPGCILLASDDPLLSHDSAAARGQRAGATLTELDGLSHFWMLQDPARSAAAIEAFWATLDDISVCEKSAVSGICAGGVPITIAISFEVRERDRARIAGERLAVHVDRDLASRGLQYVFDAVLVELHVPLGEQLAERVVLAASTTRCGGSRSRRACGVARCTRVAHGGLMPP